MARDKKRTKEPMRVRVFPFLLDVRQEDQCMVRHESYGEGVNAWHVFTIAQVISSRKQPLKPIITLHGMFHQRIRETMRSQENIDIEFVLDQALNYINETWLNQFPKSDIKMVQSSTLVVGVVKGDKLCIADRGSSIGKMVMTQESGKKNIVPVISPKPKQKGDDVALFESIVCGDLPPNARVIIGTSLIRNLGRNDVFMQLLSKRTTNLSEIWSRMKRKLSSKGFPHCAGILLESYANESVTTHVAHKKSLQDYVHQPPEPHIAPFLKANSFLRKFLAVIVNTFSAVGRLLRRFTISLRRILPSWFRIPSFVSKPFGMIGTTMSSSYNKVAKNQTSQAVHKKTKRLSFTVARTLLLSLLWIVTRIFSPLGSISKSGGKKFARLPRARKLALGGAFLAIVVFTVGLSVNRYYDQKRTVQTLVDATVLEFTDAIESAESKLIFNDILGARTALRQAENLIADLPANNKDYAPVISDLQSQLLAIKKDILKEKHVALSRNVFAGDITQTSPRRVFFSDGRLITVNASSITDVDREQHTDFSSSLPENTVYTQSDDGLLFIIDGVVQHYDASSGSLTSSDLVLDGARSMIDAQQFGTRLYSVYSDNSILRHSPSTSGFARGTSWLREDSPLKRPVDIVIDGNVYILDGGKTIHKLFKGASEPFKNDSIDPPLQHATHIWTDADSDFLYVLEPARRRLIILSDRGVMQSQYVFDRAVEDFAINESKQQGYTVVGQNVYSFVLTHLK